MKVDSWYLENLVCPKDHSNLVLEKDKLHCLDKQHSYPVVDGMPIMLLEDQEQTMELVHSSIKRSKGELIDQRSPELYLESLGVSEEEKALALSLIGQSKIDPVVSVLIGATSGHLYKKLVGKLQNYPIPDLRLESGSGKQLLDIGCSWGRWSIAAYKLGYKVVGIDPSLGAIMAARRVNNSLGFNIKYVVADARFLPFRNNYFNIAFSYSVLQHFSKQNTELCLEEISRVLKKKGYSFIQLANQFGIRNFYHIVKRKFKEPTNFEVRYWKPRELINMFNKFIGSSTLEADGYLGLGIQSSDMELMSAYHRGVIYISETLKKISKKFKPITYIADSLYIKSVKNE